MNRPETKAEQMYCWFFWLEAIAEPSLTRKILDELDYLPEFQASWGSEWKWGEHLVDKKHNIKELYE